MEEFNSYEVEFVPSLGLLYTHPHPEYRSSMKRVVQFSLGDANLPNFPPDLYIESAGVITEYSEQMIQILPMVEQLHPRVLAFQALTRQFLVSRL